MKKKFNLKNQNQFEIFSFQIQKDFVVVTRPQRIPIDFLLDAIQENKKNPLKKNRAVIHCGLMFKSPFKMKDII